MTRKRRFFRLTTAVIAIQAFTFYLPSEAFTLSSPTRKSPCNRRIPRTSIQRVLELRQQKHNKLEDVIMKTESASTAPPSLP
eukprot:scaffold33608_cov76-Amphora_coffeaeformis.AAC.2